MNLDPTNVNAYATALQGLTQQQAAFVLSTQGLEAAQQQAILTELGLISTTGQLTTAQMTEALTSKQCTAADAEALLLNAGLITTDTAEAIAINNVSIATLKELVAKGKLTETQAKLIASKAGLIWSNNQETKSMLGLGKGITGLAKGIGKLIIANPIVSGLTGALVALTAASIIHNKVRKKTSENAKSLIETYQDEISQANNNAKAVEDLTERYEELSKGVDVSSGKNVSLNTEEYAEYNDIVNQIAEMFPELIKGYDAEGNAILSLKGNVDELTEAYKRAQKEAYNTLIISGENGDGTDIVKHYKMTQESSFWDKMFDFGSLDVGKGVNYNDAIKQLQEFQSLTAEEYGKILRYTGSLEESAQKELAGLEDKKHLGYGSFIQKELEINTDYLDNNFEDDFNAAKIQAQALVEKYQAEIDSRLQGIKSLANAYLMTNSDYENLEEDAQTAASLIVNSMTTATANEFEDQTDVSVYVTQLVNQLKNATPIVTNALIGLFDTDFSDMSVNDAKAVINQYINTIAEYLEEDPVELKVKLGFEEYDNADPLIEHVKGILEDEFDDKVGELDLEDLKIAANDIDVEEGVLYTWDELINKIEAAKNKTEELSDSIGTLAELNEKRSSLDSIYDTFEEDGYIKQEDVASMLEENPEYIYYLTEVEGKYKLNQQALEDWKDVVADQQAIIDNMMGKNTYLENYDGLLDNVMLDASHGRGDGTGDTGLAESDLDSLILKNKELNQALLDNKISVVDYFNSISDSITSSGLESALESLNGQFDQTTDYIEQTVSVIGSELSDALLQSNKRFLKGQTSVEDYIDELSAGAKAQQKLLKATYGLTTSNGEYADSIDDADEKTQSAIDSYNELVNVQKQLEEVQGFVDALSDNAEFLNQYTDSAGNLMDSIFDDSRFSSYVNSLSQELVNFASINQANMDAVANALVNTAGISSAEAMNLISQGSAAVSAAVGNSLSAVQGMTSYAMSNVSGSITNASSAIGSVLSSLGNMISSFDFEIKATPYISGGFKFEKDENGVPTGMTLPTFGFKITGSGGSSVQSFANSLTSAGNYFSSSGADQAASQALNIGSYLPSGTGKGATVSGNRPGSSGSGGGGGGGNQTEETFDWIERKLEALQRKIEKLDKTVSATYKKWGKRNKALAKQISAVKDQITAQQQAYDYYMEKANDVDLSEEYKRLVRNGTIDIETITDEALIQKIQTYKDFYDKAMECKDAILSSQDELANLARKEFDHVVQKYEDKLSVIEHNIDMIEGAIDQVEAKGHIVSKSYYKDLLKQEKSNLKTLKNERKALQEALAKALEDGDIEEGSEEWYSMISRINEVDQAIQEANTTIIELGNNIRDVDWTLFDKMQEMKSRIQSESDFFIDLMSEDKMFDDTGSITSQGQATIGLHAVNYNTYMAQAEDYAKEIEEINKDLAEDPYNQDLLERRNELIDSQRDMISAAEDEKQAIKDLMSDGYDALLTYMNELIDKRKEMLQSVKDMYDYEKNIAEQTKEIASLEKQLSVYGGNDSEENRAIVQKLKVSLEEARENLEQTEYDKFISDQEQMYDKIASETEEWINERLDNIDGLLGGIFDSVNENAEGIKTTLIEEAAKVGLTLSEEMDSIWSTDGEYTSVVTEYYDGFSSALTTTNNILNNIEHFIEEMVKDEEEEEDNGGSNPPDDTPTNPPDETPTNPPDDTPTNPPQNPDPKDENGEKGSFFVRKKDSYPKSKLDINTSIQDRLKYHDFDSSFAMRAKYYEGMGLGSASSYKGSASQNKAMINWMKQNGYSQGGTIGGLVRSSGEDGFVLAKTGEEILSLEKINALREAFIKINPLVDTLKAINVPNLNNISRFGNVSNHVDLSITLPNVTNYDEFVSSMQSDPRFEKIVKQMTIGSITGQNSLAKYRF